MAYSRDPHWITVRFMSKCAKTECARPIVKGERAFYYPTTKTVLCESCGTKAAAEFAASVADEEAYNR